MYFELLNVSSVLIVLLKRIHSIAIGVYSALV